MPKFIFYPGCSLERSGRAYYESLFAIRETLGIELEEVKDWNCCGATEYASTNLQASHALVGRNLAIAQQQVNGTRTVMAACSACYLNLAKTDFYMRKSPQLATTINTALEAGGLHYDAGAVQVRHLLDVLYNEIGVDAIRAKVVKPLTGLRVAAYYGCQVPRPDYDKRFNNHEYPNQLEAIMKALGATVIDFPLKTHCCGGHMTQISEASAYGMIRRIVHNAADYKADIVVTLCPMCQLNLDAYQVEMNKFFKTTYNVPTVFFTQLMGLAFGKDAVSLGFGREFVDARPALAKMGVELPASEDEAPAPPPRKGAAKKDGLPMPKMPDVD